MRVLDIDNKTLRKIQLLQLEMLIEVDRICRKRNIKYIICGGTLLGAVRHQGFIPWDDDIDVRMERKEYEKFCKACHEELDKSKFFLQNYKTDKEYPWYYGKMRYLNTEYIRSGQEHLKMHSGIFIDIFPSDGLPDDLKSQKAISRKCFLLKKILYANVGKKSAKGLLARIGYSILSLIPNKMVFEALDKIGQKYQDDKYENITCYSLVDYNVERFLKRSWHFERVELTFEGKKFYAPKEYKKWLEFVYGEDYMQLPPVEDRRIHNTASKITLPDDIG